ncbi:urease accessory protein UreD [Methylococcus sp. EFPC2]|uniref:urease accessory protein UreD n=1 Tax=Methylococcus sp. EFPC2 TaxID=2812648 RepID=UPI001F07B49C|nr:urease accessory protein UreD [Methylococcus sp. EFPC2]
MTSEAGSWRAELRLEFAPRAGRTALVRRAHRGPLLVQRPFYPEGTVAHVYLLHPPGGVAGGDELSIEAVAQPGAHALLTTPAAGKFYRSDGRLARQKVALSVADDAALEWLPQETIVFDGAALAASLRVDLSPRSRYVGWDFVSLGRPASGEVYRRGQADFRLRIFLEGRPLLLENFAADGRFARENWGLAGRPMMATMLAYPFPCEGLDAVQALIADDRELGVTLLDGLLVMRGIGYRMAPLRRTFCETWRVVRPWVMGREVCWPRIWAT